MAKIVVYDMNRKQVSERDLVEEVFNADVKEYLLHDMVRYQRAARRQGTAKVKNRSEVRGGGKKPFRQKGTGNARQGTPTAPNQVSPGSAGRSSQLRRSLNASSTPTIPGPLAASPVPALAATAALSSVTSSPPGSEPLQF